jgi:hypothetical protein
MHELVMRIKDPDLCAVFAENAVKRGHPELATQALRRAVDLRAEDYGTTSPAELAAVRAIYAYEAALTFNKGKRTRATGTWQMVSRQGIFAAIAKRMEGRNAVDLTPALDELGMADYSFTAVRDLYPEAFEQMVA